MYVYSRVYWIRKKRLWTRMFWQPTTLTYVLTSFYIFVHYFHYLHSNKSYTLSSFQCYWKRNTTLNGWKMNKEWWKITSRHTSTSDKSSTFSQLSCQARSRKENGLCCGREKTLEKVENIFYCFIQIYEKHFIIIIINLSRSIINYI